MENVTRRLDVILCRWRDLGFVLVEVKSGGFRRVAKTCGSLHVCDRTDAWLTVMRPQREGKMSAPSAGTSQSEIPRCARNDMLAGSE